MLQQEEKQVSFSGTGCKFEVEQDGDWETDTLRTGCLGSVTINLPRIIYESEKEKNKFFEILKERYELATRAIQIKQRTLRQHGKTTLPFINQTTNGDTYLRLENCSGIINLAGLKESIEAFNDKNTINKEHMDFTGEIVQNLTTFKQKTGKKHMKRLFPAILRSQESSERMAQLDIEKYGIAKTKFSGTRDKPFYSTTRRLRFQAGNFPTIPPESLEIDQKLQGLNSGGNLTIIELEEPHQPEELVSLTKQLTEKQTVEFFTYNRRTTYCSNCQKSWIGILHKCPSCGAISTLVIFDRFTTT
jgi:ribonucleoside-triphosphate reductase